MPVAGGYWLDRAGSNIYWIESLEQERADAHECRAFLNAHFEVPAHAHRQVRQGQTASTGEFIAQAAQFRERRPRAFGIIIVRGHRHEPADGNAGERGERIAEMR